MKLLAMILTRLRIKLINVLGVWLFRHQRQQSEWGCNRLCHRFFALDLFAGRRHRHRWRNTTQWRSQVFSERNLWQCRWSFGSHACASGCNGTDLSAECQLLHFDLHHRSGRSEPHLRPQYSDRRWLVDHGVGRLHLRR